MSYSKKEKAWITYGWMRLGITTGIYIIFGKQLVAFTQSINGNLEAIPLIGPLLQPYLPLEAIAANLIVFGVLGMLVSMTVHYLDEKKV